MVTYKLLSGDRELVLRKLHPIRQRNNVIAYRVTIDYRIGNKSGKKRMMLPRYLVSGKSDGEISREILLYEYFGPRMEMVN